MPEPTAARPHTQAGDALPVRMIAAVWLPFACGYYLSYMFRTINAIISQDLVRDLGLNPSQLGLLTSAYFLAFAGFQLPLGVLLDRFGPRRIEALLLLAAALGAWLFSVADGIELLVVGRALIGLGVSACLMAAIKAFVQWFPISRLATMNGWLLASGGLGALSASLPVEAALHLTDWRGLFGGIAAITLGVAAMVFFLVPDRPAGETKENFGQLVQGVRTVFASKVFWRVSVAFMIVQGTYMSVHGLWIGPWLRDVAGYESTGAILAAVALAMMVGFTTFGSLSDRLSRAGINDLLVLKAGFGGTIVLFALIGAGVTTAVPLLWIGYALCSTCATTLVYPILSKRFPPQLAGRVNTAINLLVFVWAFAAQWGIGAVIGLWPAEAGHYALEGYRAGFGLCAVLQVAAFALLLTQRE